jgi:ADP-ribose pyrophosphatase YjhB (NUDIX family)
MDLTLPAGDFTLNIRVHIVVETQNGFLFFKSKSGHYACVGGRVKAGESSLKATQRELEEETGLKLEADKFKLISVVENFYTDKKTEPETKFHEIGFVYFISEKITFENIPTNFVQENNLLEINKSDISNHNILPTVAKEIILSHKFSEISNFIVN